MLEISPLERSPQLMSRDDSALLVVDVQQRLIDVMSQSARLVWNIQRLVEGAGVLNVAVAATEQSPEKLGATVNNLSERISSVSEKVVFSCRGCHSIFERWTKKGIYKILLAGVETHVCVQQTAFDLLAGGFDVYLAVDATATRFAVDRDVAIRRMDSAGVTITTTEAALFEWCEQAGTPEFKKISQIVRQDGP